MPEWPPSQLQNHWSEACGSGRFRINQQSPSAVTANVCAVVGASGAGVPQLSQAVSAGPGGVCARAA